MNHFFFYDLMTSSDIPRLYTAFAEWASCIVYIISLKKRYHPVKVSLISLSWLLAQCVFLFITRNIELSLWLPVMLFAMFMMFLHIYSCCELSWKDVGFCCVRAFVLAEFTAALQWQIYSFFVYRGMQQKLWLQNIFIFLIYGFILTCSYWLLSRKLPGDRGMGIKSRELINSLVISLGVFLVSNVSFINTNNPFSGNTIKEIFYIRTLVDFCGLLLLYAQQDEWQKRNLEYEMKAVNSVLSRHYEQYQMSRENIELLNQKYHDLKYQIMAIRQESDPVKKEHYLTEMESGIRQYEAENRTGNGVLDTVLTSKSIYCTQHNINFTCVADGTILKFMDTIDICTIFGNALDNAIEYVEQLGDKEKRLIRTAVFTRNDFIMIRFENYIEQIPRLENGIPNTTKRNKSQHGYGLKSIRMIANKYGGSMTITTNENWFALKVLIPKR